MKKYLLSLKFFRDGLLSNLMYMLYYSSKSLIHNIRSGCSPVSPAGLRKFKESDTLVILGAGASLNDLTEQNWQEIGCYDVAGTTSTIILQTKQTFYFFEGSSDADELENWYPGVHSEAVKKFSSGQAKTMIWKNTHHRIVRNYLNMKHFRSPLATSDLLCEDEASLRRILRFILKLKFSKYIFLQKRASLFCIAWMGIVLGYKKILFCGVDLINSKYFYDEDKQFDSYNLYNVFNDPTAPHRTSSGGRGFPVELALKCLSEECPQVSFYTASQKSKLAGIFKVWNFECQST